MVAQKRLPSAERRAQIADAALAILSTQDARTLTAKEIGRRIGITDGAVFRHFATKEEIIDAAIDRLESALQRPPRGGDPLERLGLFFVERAIRVRAKPEIVGLAFNDRLAEVAGEAGARRVRQLVGRSVAFVRRCIRDAQDRGGLDENVDPNLYTALVTGALRFAVHSRRPPREIWDELLLILRKEAP